MNLSFVEICSKFLRTLHYLTVPVCSGPTEATIRSNIPVMNLIQASRRHPPPHFPAGLLQGAAEQQSQCPPAANITHSVAQIHMASPFQRDGQMFVYVRACVRGINQLSQFNLSTLIASVVIRCHIIHSENTKSSQVFFYRRH